MKKAKRAAKRIKPVAGHWYAIGFDDGAPEVVLCTDDSSWSEFISFKRKNVNGLCIDDSQIIAHLGAATAPALPANLKGFRFKARR